MAKQRDVSSSDGPNGGDRPQMPVTDRRTPKRSEIIARDLATFIVDSDLQPGRALPPEHEMIASLGVGRTTLREALRLLETRGVLTIKSGPGGGPVVRRPRLSDLGESLTLILQFEGATLAEVVEARQSLEFIMCRAAATKITDAAIEELREINSVLAQNPQDLDLVLEQNVAFHRRIGAASGNVVLQMFLETVISVGDGRAVGVTYGPKQVAAIAVAHDRIIDALAAHDPEAAGAAMQDHLDNSARFFRRHYASVLDRPIRWVQ
jgi:DNA-binding FadR family transcriptional regulator